MLPIKADLLTKNHNRPALRDRSGYAIRELRGVVVHWTANTNPGAHAQANRNYFNNQTDRYASAHYVVDDHTIIQCIPDNEVAYHVGDTPLGKGKYAPDGERIRDGSSSLTPNYFVIGFEMCVNSDGDWNKTYGNAVDLSAHLLRKHGLTLNDLYRHHDITGKNCPNMLLTLTAWEKFKSDVAKAMSDDPAPQLEQGRVTPSDLNVRTGPGVSYNAVAKLPQNTTVNIFEKKDGWLRIGPNRWVSGSYVETIFTTRWVLITSRTEGDVRATPAVTVPIIDTLPNGIWTPVIGEKGDWYALATDRWIQKAVTQPLNVQVGEVTGTTNLNVRFGPGTKYDIIYQLQPGDQVKVFSEQDGWFQIAHREWVSSKYVKTS